MKNKSQTQNYIVCKDGGRYGASGGIGHDVSHINAAAELNILNKNDGNSR